MLPKEAICYQPTELTTERLVLRPLIEADRWLFHQLYSDPKVMRNTAPPFSPERIDKMFDNTLTLMAKKQPVGLVWVIKEKDTQQSIGIICLYDIDYQSGCCRIGLMLLRLANGKLYPEEALARVTSYCFFDMGLENVFGEFTNKNFAAKRYARKLGYKFVESSTEHELDLFVMNKAKWQEALNTA